MRAGKLGHALANTNIYAVPLLVIGSLIIVRFRFKGDRVGQMLLKSQNEQEVQSQLVGYRWSITQTQTASLGKG